MDRNFYTDSFERLLKEKSDEFRMYPVRKVWHSIYNNLYPGRRYPSAIMSITIITVLGLISFLNGKNLKTSAEIFKPESSIKNFFANSPSVSMIHKTPLSFINVSNKNNFLAIFKKDLYDNLNETITYSTKNKLFLEQRPIVHHTLNLLQPNNNNIISTVFTSSNNNNNKVTAANLKQNNNESSVKESASIENTLRDHYSVNNDNFSKKWADKLVWQVYASPYVAYGESYVPKTNSIQGQDNSNSSFDNSSIGLEAGTAMQYSLSGLIKLKAGVQFNYASYNMEAYQNEFSSEMSGISPVTLHNEMYQFSLPVGVEFKLLQKNNLQWNAGATIQPSFIAGGNTYLLSTDTHNFIDEPSILNKWNFNAGFETFITYKVNDLTWQFGPQVRYQFASAYGKAYTPVNEKLANFGVKIGISKVLR
jgi:hypothetical protein